LILLPGNVKQFTQINLFVSGLTFMSLTLKDNLQFEHSVSISSYVPICFVLVSKNLKGLLLLFVYVYRDSVETFLYKKALE